MTKHYYLKILLYSLFFLSINSMANSWVFEEDGLAMISLKNGYPCIYRGNELELTGLTIRDGSTSIYKTIHSYERQANDASYTKDNCYLYTDNFKYNTPYLLLVDAKDKFPYYYHATRFCVLKSQTGKTRLVEARKSYFWETNSIAKCTNKD